MSFNWSAGNVERATKLWADGLTASAIAFEMNARSRNVILGKLKRLGLLGVRPVKPKKFKLPKQPKQPKLDAARVRSLTQLAAAMEATDIPPDQSPDAVTLHGLKSNSCRWPLGDPATPEFRFCGTTKERGYVYCARHAAMAYRKAER